MKSENHIASTGTQRFVAKLASEWQEDSLLPTIFDSDTLKLMLEMQPEPATTLTVISAFEFAFSQLYDTRALTSHGVDSFATVNLKDCDRPGFRSVWNPLSAQSLRV